MVNRINRDFKVEPVNLNVTLPSDWITMVAMQPHIHLTNTEPFKWPDDKKNEQIAGIKRTLEIAKEKHAHFTLFPEYSVPGLEGINTINDIIANSAWPNKTIIIGGADGLNKAEYEQLYQQPNIECHDNNKHNCVGQTEWVNCSITWVKDDNGILTKYIQPKICPAWPEKNIHWADMFCGKAINIFETKYDNKVPFLFASFICFDWIGKINNPSTKVIDDFLQSINNICNSPKGLHWVFVLQENDEPNHDLFIRATSEFLTQRSNYPMIDRSKSVIVFINNSGRTNGGIIDANRAFTSCVFPADVSFDTKGCPPTFSFASERFRKKVINRCGDSVFREQRPCIHSFKVRVAQFLDITQDSRCRPIENAEVHPLDEGLKSPCFPGQPVPACIKWVNDNLDGIESLGNRYPEILTDPTIKSHEAILSKIRILYALKQADNIHYATASHGNSNNLPDADTWNTQEILSLKHLLHTVTICGIADKRIDLENSIFHATTTIDGKLYEIIAIMGHKHEHCTTHFDNFCHAKVNHHILIISRDVDNNPYTKKFSQNITKWNPSEAVTDTKFTDLAYGVIQKGYFDLLSIFRDSQDEHSLKEGLIRYV